MEEITRREYRIEWFIGDHGPRHVHVYDAKERFLGRLDLRFAHHVQHPSLISIVMELSYEAK